VDTVQGTACIGNIGDGKTFVRTADRVIRARTNERGKETV